MLEKFWKKKLGKSVGTAVLFKYNTDQQLHNMNHSLNRKTHNLLCVYIFLFTEQCPRIRNQPVVAHSSWTALPLHFSRPRRSVLAEGATLIPGPCVFPYIQLAAQTASWENSPGLGTHHSCTHLVSLLGRAGLHSWVRHPVWLQPQLSCHARAADSTLAPQASWPAAPSSGWPHRPSTNEASWFLFFSKWIN